MMIYSTLVYFWLTVFYIALHHSIAFYLILRRVILVYFMLCHGMLLRTDYIVLRYFIRFV